MDIFSWSELLLVAFVALLVIGPERLPETLRTLGLWIGRLTRSFNSVKAELEKEIGMDEIRQQLHNEAVMDEMKRIEREVKKAKPENLDQDIAPPPLSDDTPPTPPVENTIQPPEQAEQAEQAEQSNGEDSGAEVAEIAPTPRSEAELETLHTNRLNQAKKREPDEPDNL